MPWGIALEKPATSRETRGQPESIRQSGDMQGAKLARVCESDGREGTQQPLHAVIAAEQLVNCLASCFAVRVEQNALSVPALAWLAQVEIPANVLQVILNCGAAEAASETGATGSGLRGGAGSAAADGNKRDAGGYLSVKDSKRLPLGSAI